MKVICINNEFGLEGFFCNLTIGKSYKVLYDNGQNYKIVDDSNTEWFYRHEKFKSFKELRKEKLLKIGSL